MSREQMFLLILFLALLEVLHLKWVVWNFWDCRKCSAKHKDCSCSSKWFLYL